MKKYTFLEAVKMLMKNYTLVFQELDSQHNGEPIPRFLKSNAHNRLWVDSQDPNYSNQVFMNGYFVLVQQPVSVKEALEAHRKGKTIRCVMNGNTRFYDGKNDQDDALLSIGGLSVSDTELLDGTWYIEEQ